MNLNYLSVTKTYARVFQTIYCCAKSLRKHILNFSNFFLTCTKICIFWSSELVSKTAWRFCALKWNQHYEALSILKLVKLATLSTKCSQSKWLLLQQAYFRGSHQKCLFLTMVKLPSGSHWNTNLTKTQIAWKDP